MCVDPRTGSAIGGFNQLNTIDPEHNRRSYAARGYYEPNADRPNLALQLNALVSKIEFSKDGEDARATAVQFVVDDTTHTIKVKKEVIVSGGAINSPQILELSGIGSRSVLEKAGVEVVVELPGVGDNLNDHTATGAVLVCISSLSADQKTDISREPSTKCLLLRHSSVTPNSCSKLCRPISSTKPVPSWAHQQLQASLHSQKSNPTS